MFIFATFIILATTAVPGADQAENAQEEEAVRKKEVIVEIPNRQEFSAGKKADHAGQHKQGAEDAGGPAHVIDNGCQFHHRCFWY
jgi:hypothetical protein